jgi:hypothetical protein
MPGKFIDVRIVYTGMVMNEKYHLRRGEFKNTQTLMQKGKSTKKRNNRKLI